MHSAFRYTVILISFALFLSCTDRSDASRLLKEARSIVEDNPVQAKAVVDSIFIPETELEEREYMQYIITKVQAYYKNYHDISSDTLIFKARNYFHTMDHYGEDSFLAHFYSACVYREKDLKSKAIRDYKKALSVAQKQNSLDREAMVLYNIADLYFAERAYTKAFDYYDSASKKYYGNNGKQLISLQSAGQALLLNGEKERAFHYFDRALDLAKETGNKVEEAKCLQNIAVALSEQGEYDRAIALFRQAKESDTDSNADARFNLNVASAFFSAGKKDSVLLYMSKLKRSIRDVKDEYLLASAYEFLAEMHIDSEDYFQANSYLKSKDSCMLLIMKKSNIKELSEAERKYDIAAKENQLIKSEARNYRLALVLAMSFIVMAIICAVVIYFYLNHRKQREKILRQENENIQLQKQAERYECLNAVFRSHIGNITFFKDQINNLLVKYDRRDAKNPLEGFSKIRHAVAEMESTTNKGYENFISNYLRSLYLMEEGQKAQLKSEDQLLITLLHARCEHSQIASLLQIRNHALTTRKSRLKEKLFKIGLSQSQISEIFQLK